MINNGHSTLVDGDFGPGTERRLKEFQQKSGLNANGVVDMLTAHELYQISSSTGQSSGTTQNSGNQDSNSQNILLSSLFLLSKGSSNKKAVEELQTLLIQHGHSTLIDGDFGSGTERRLKEFPISVSLPNTGYVDLSTANRLLGIQSSSSNSNSNSSGTQSSMVNGVLTGNPSVAKGSSDTAAVIEIQTLLTRCGIATTIDGDFGPKTEQKVQSFQISHGLVVTGVVDVSTAEELNSVANSSQSTSTENTGTTTDVASTTGMTITGTPSLVINSPYTDLVKELQTRLTVHHFWNGTINGVFDGAVERAVNAFQNARFGPWSDDGIVGPQTAAALYQANQSDLSTNNGQDSLAPTITPEYQQKKTNTAVATAQQQIGKPYVFNENGPDAFDCSGLTSFAWVAAGVSISDYSRSQVNETIPIPKSQAQPGDLLFNTSTSLYDNPNHTNNNKVSHVSIYSGNDKKVYAPGTGPTVKEKWCYLVKNHECWSGKICSVQIRVSIVNILLHVPFFNNWHFVIGFLLRHSCFSDTKNVFYIYNFEPYNSKTFI